MLLDDRRELKLPEGVGTSSKTTPSGSLPPVQGPHSRPTDGYLTRDGIRLPYQLELRKHFKGKECHAKVGLDGIVVDGRDVAYTSPSLAAMAITSYNVNGWHFWEYKDPATQTWRLLNELRR
jgi:hypothetical protein